MRRVPGSARSIRTPAVFALLIALPAAALAPAASRAALPPLIPREVLWSNPSRAAPRISPDGRTLAFLARSKTGVMNLWVRGLDGGAERAVTNDREGDIPGAFWAGDSRRLLYLRDSDGDENWHLFSKDLDSGELRDLTPFVGVRAQDIIIDPRHPRELLVGLNLRDRSRVDMYRVRLETGAVTLDTPNPGDVTEWCVDSSFAIRACAALDSATSNTVLRVRDRAGSPWRTLQVWPFLEAGSDRDQRLIAFSRDGRSLWALSPIGSPTSRLVAIDVRSGRARDSLPADPRADVWCPLDVTGGYWRAMVLRHPATGAVQAWAVQYLKPEWKVVDPTLRPDFAALAAAHRGVPIVLSRDQADSRWTVAYLLDDGPTAFFLWDRRRQRAESLFVDTPELARYTLAEQTGRVIRARDGLELACYLTLPPGVPAKRLPLIVNPHGGPWARDEWGYLPDVQWLANRGYAVLQVEYRGSSGFGSAFINASIGQFPPGAMLDDLTDAVRWAVRQGIADSTRVGIYGWSYGGYATLSGLAFTPGLYACGVDGVGPSDMAALVRTFPPYWGVRRKRWLLRMGDVLADSALNRRISPLYHVDRIRAPLLIGHGVNDPRAAIANSERIVAALRNRGGQVTFVVYPDEGHGFARPENNQDFFGRMEEFLAKRLRGRAEPWRPVKGSSAQLR